MPTNRTSIALYRWTLREFQKLPANCRDYYLKLARSYFVGHSTEPDELQIQQLQRDGIERVKWLVHKYRGPDARVSQPPSIP